ncbi:hypothetical protein HPB51_022945 [Rhipicephalus microplus]|uniref:RRM domain-containing protein n=1 Tax=Rhipicephalus microplus TaxID=6941 RepID=A0A9J6DQW1_RHIMP|nr:hypothetical protein HPB51_022945 [Rhipicephalus microplus]
MKRTEKNRLLRRIKLRPPQHWWKAKRVRTSVATQENAPVYMNHLRTNTSRTPMRRREMMVAAVQLQVIFVLQSTLGKVTPLPLGNSQGSKDTLIKTDDSGATAETRQAPQKEQRRGVVYVSHIPHGFYEEEMKKYFSQFGTVTKLRLSRSGKTGGSRGYAFIEFLSEDVAKIVADTMDGYLFFNKIMKCRVIPREHVHEGLFRHFRYPFPLRKEVVRTVHNRRRTAESEKRSARRRLATLERTKAQLRKMGVNCDFVPEYLWAR